MSMEIKWTKKAFSDLDRLYNFLSPLNIIAASNIIKSLVKAPLILTQTPRIGERLFEFEPREIRKFLVERYEIRYEIQDQTIYILRIWHTREYR